MPTLASTPTSRTATPIGASPAASGSQVWNGTSGALIANARKKPRNSQICVPVGASWTTRTSVAQSNVPLPSSLEAIEYAPIADASISRPPRKEYRKNFTAAYCRFAPP